MRTTAAIATALLAVTAGARAEQHGRDEPCGAAHECARELYCVRNTCQPEAALWSIGTETEPRDAAERATRFYLGGSLGGGLAGNINTYGNPVAPAASLAARVGVRFGRVRLQLEGTPFAAIYGGPVGLAGLDATAGYYARLDERISWPLRVGAGAAMTASAVDYFSPLGNRPPIITGWFQLRFDVAGIAVRMSRRVVVEADIPSFRILMSANNVYSLLWLITLGFTYDL